MSEEQVRPGLENVVAAETRLSKIDGDSGELVIGGFPVEELAANASFEETVSLLWTDELPRGPELEAFGRRLAERRPISPATRESLREAAEAGLPAMDALRIGAASASLAPGADVGGDGGDDVDQAPLIVAQLPTVVATYWRFRQGEEPVAPRADLSHAANYLYMLTGEEPSAAQVAGLETYLNTVVDHGLNASTFTARTIASTESDVVSAVTGAIGALKGPLHGGAPGPVLEMLQEIDEAGDPEGYLREKLEAGERLMGFGHRVYDTRDPRAAVLSDAAEQFYRDGEGGRFFELAREIEDVAVDLLAEYKPGRDLATNVEFYTAVLLHGVGIPRELFSATFAVSRVGGWTAHYKEQQEDNRLIRPRASYVGETDREWVPVEQR
ncbi:MAG: citrate synthase [Halobacteriaceae archaeon]